jgi:hypothetical protein
LTSQEENKLTRLENTGGPGAGHFSYLRSSDKCSALRGALEHIALVLIGGADEKALNWVTQTRNLAVTFLRQDTACSNII